MDTKITMQKKGQDWIDEAGNKVMYNQLKKSELVHEKTTYNAAKAALKVSQQISKLKQYIVKLVDQSVEAFHNDYTGKKTPEQFKGTYTIFNFDRSIKVEVKATNPITFDDLTINQAKAELETFLKDGVSAKNAAVKEMVLDAFNTSSGKLDVKKILSLKRYAERINDAQYNKAMALIDAAIRRPATAKYYRVWIKDDAGKYQSVPLSIADV